VLFDIVRSRAEGGGIVAWVRRSTPRGRAGCGKSP
jgi:hypothetical protein